MLNHLIGTITVGDTLVWAVLVLAFLILVRRPPSTKLPHDPTLSPSGLTAGEKWYELKTLEYKLAAERYDNIYQAVWQNFSYMAILSGGIATFGVKDQGGLQPHLVALALTPLLFWFLASYLPLDHYGNETRERLAAIETELNNLYFSGEKDPKLQHFRLFEATKG